MRRIPILICILILTASPAAWAEFPHSARNELLHEHVHAINDGRSTQVDYRALAEKRTQLGGYLQQLAAVSRDQFDGWPREEQLAFLINAYNGWTVELILSRYPQLESIKDLGSLFQSPWKKKFIPLLGETLSLDDIEHGLIRGSGRYNDPRIHFAVNCASIGCPALKNEAYTGASLEQQLEEAARLFLADRDRNRLEGSTLKVSSIFKWYRDDFTTGWRGASNLEQFLALYGDSLSLTQGQNHALQQGDIRIDFLEYDWRLNDRQ